MLPLYMGLKVVPTVVITKEIQRRTHKKYRINKKWLKRYGYKTIPDDEKMFMTPDTIYCTPKGLARLETIIKKEVWSNG